MKRTGLSRSERISRRGKRNRLSVLAFAAFTCPSTLLSATIVLALILSAFPEHAPALDRNLAAPGQTTPAPANTSYGNHSRGVLLDDTELSSIERSESSIYVRKGTAVPARAGVPSADSAQPRNEPDTDSIDEADDKSGSTRSSERSSAHDSDVPVPHTPLSAGRTADPDQPKIVDDRLLSELSRPAARPALSRSDTPRRIAAKTTISPAFPQSTEGNIDTDDYYTDNTDAFGDIPPVRRKTELSQIEKPVSPPMDDFPELEGYDLPGEFPDESPQLFQSHTEEIPAATKPTDPLGNEFPSVADMPSSVEITPVTGKVPSVDTGPNASSVPFDGRFTVTPSKPAPTASGTRTAPTAGPLDPPKNSEPLPEQAEFPEFEGFDLPDRLPAESPQIFQSHTEGIPSATEPTGNEFPSAADMPSSAEITPAAGYAPPTDTALNASSVPFDSGFTVTPSKPAPTASGTHTVPAVGPLDAPENSEPLPEQAEFPEFARDAYEALEPSEKELASVVRHEKATPERERESIAEKERAEKELKSEYDTWLAKQRAGKKEKEKLPRYLQPLEDDHAVFESADSPYARNRSNHPDGEHKFVREISAADLKLMSDVSSNRELMDWEKEQDMPVDWSKYSVTALYNKWRDYLGMGPNEKEALAIMKKATLALMEYEKTKEPKKLREAAELYEKAGKKWPESVLEEDALFYAGECHFFEKNYTKAKTFYKALLTKYSNSVLRRDAMERLYCIGVYWVKCAEDDPEIIGRIQGKQRPVFSDFAGAKDAFEAIFTNDVSDRGRAPDAVFALANAYMRRGVEQGDASFDEAAKYYQRLYEFYPACEHADKAYQLAMLALYQSYRGPFYDPTPLRKAEEIAKAAQRARKGDPDVIAEQLRLIKEKQAEYLLVRGEYYEKKKLYASARNYYNRLVTEHPDSEYAVKGAERYTAIRENPAESDQFALIRPIAPFLPKSKNQYFEDHPGKLLSAAADQNGKANRDFAEPDFTQLEKTAETEKGGGTIK
jgi:tetratricopeptide (TPR) repeat protein